MSRFARTASLVVALALVSCAIATDKTVYVVETGKKYHTKNCRLKKNSKGMKLSEAKKKGYTACKVCKP